MITLESTKADNKFHIVRYGTKIGYIEKNRNTKEWYVGSIRYALDADELQVIVDKMNKLNAASATDEPPTGCAPLSESQVASFLGVARPAVPESLDVERLAMALAIAVPKLLGQTTLDPDYDRTIDRQWAEAIAREYAALPSKEPTDDRLLRRV